MTDNEMAVFQRVGFSPKEIEELQEGLMDIELGKYIDTNEVFQRIKDKIIFDNLAQKNDL